MQDITEMVESASMCIRELWNSHFRGPMDDMSSCPHEFVGRGALIEREDTHVLFDRNAG